MMTTKEPYRTVPYNIEAHYYFTSTSFRRSIRATLSC